LALRKRLNASWTSADVQGLPALSDFFAMGGCPDLAAGFFTIFCRPWLAKGPLRDFLTCFEAIAFDLGWGLRVIFAMIRVY